MLNVRDGTVEWTQTKVILGCPREYPDGSSEPVRGSLRRRTQTTQSAPRQRKRENDGIWYSYSLRHDVGLVMKEWMSNRLAEGKWKTVVAWDSNDIEQWLEQSIAAQVWFENQRGLKRCGVKSLDKCWTEWCADCDPCFTKHIFDEAISAWKDKIVKHLSNSTKDVCRSSPIPAKKDWRSSMYSFPSKMMSCAKSRIGRLFLPNPAHCPNWRSVRRDFFRSSLIQMWKKNLRRVDADSMPS